MTKEKPKPISNAQLWEMCSDLKPSKPKTKASRDKAVDWSKQRSEWNDFKLYL